MKSALHADFSSATRAFVAIRKWFLRKSTAGTGARFYSIGHSEAYELGASKLQANTEAADVLGTPISTGRPLGSISTNGTTGRAILSFSATGTKATGRVFLEAINKAGVWSLTKLTLKVDGYDSVIDLIRQSKVEIKGPRWRVS